LIVKKKKGIGDDCDWCYINNIQNNFFFNYLKKKELTHQFVKSLCIVKLVPST